MVELPNPFSGITSDASLAGVSPTVAASVPSMQPDVTERLQSLIEMINPGSDTMHVAETLTFARAEIQLLRSQLSVALASQKDVLPMVNASPQVLAELEAARERLRVNALSTVAEHIDAAIKVVGG